MWELWNLQKTDLALSSAQPSHSSALLRTLPGSSLGSLQTPDHLLALVLVCSQCFHSSWDALPCCWNKGNCFPLPPGYAGASCTLSPFHYLILPTTPRHEY